LLNLDVEEPIESASDLSKKNQDVEFLNDLDDDDINTLSFAGKQVLLYDLEKNQAELLNQYLSERAGMEVECVAKKENLWRLLKIDPMDLVIIETGATDDSDVLEVIKQTKDQFPKFQFICISGPVSLERRLQFLNAGAIDYLTRPVHLSTIAQSVLLHLSHKVDGKFATDITPQLEILPTKQELQEELTIMKEQLDQARADAKANEKDLDKAIAETKEIKLRASNLLEEKESLYLDETFTPGSDSIGDPVEDLSGAASLLDDDLKISEEINLIEEDY
jgi:Response regulator containing CheY-like receiver, AAA-type ATPase, and DNA-binding domains